MKVLINALSGIGDALMFTPAMRVLKTELPHCRIDVLAMFQSVKQLFKFHPLVNNIFFVNFLNQSKLKSLKEVLSIRSNKYDYSLNIYPSNRYEYNVLNFLLCGKKRFSYKYRHTNIFRADFLNNHLIEEINDTHNVIQNLRLVNLIIKKDINSAPPMEIFCNEEYLKNSENWFKENNLDGRLIIGVHAGSSTLKNHINKRWAKDKYVLLLQKLIDNYNAIILLFGSEYDLNKEIKNKVKGNVLLASTNNYMDSVARMKKCCLFISNDTAFLHTAAALHLPVVCIFGYTNHKELYPWQTEYRLIRKEMDCSPCFYNSPKPATCKWDGDEQFKCLKQIEVDEVFNSCVELISPYISQNNQE